VSPILLSLLAFVLVLLGILVGGWVQGKLPEGHQSSDSKEVVKLSLGIMGTLAALVLGLLVASAQSSYAARETEIKQLTADVILLDHLLDQYGKDAESVRVSLRNVVPRVADRIWREWQSTSLQAAPFKVASEGEAFYRQIQDLQPATDAQRDIKARLLQVTVDTPRRDSFFFRTWEARSQPPFLAVLLFWLTVLFGGFALLARPNATTLVALTLCALSVSAAIFLLLELDQPFSGVMATKSEPLREALGPLNS
jgi:hypothetical protein